MQQPGEPLNGYITPDDMDTIIRILAGQSGSGGIYYGLVTPANPKGTTPQPGDAWIVTPFIAVTVGTPGAFIPGAPADFAALQALGNLGQTTRWLVGSWVELADSSEAYWDGSQWQAGRATPPPATGVVPGIPGAFTPAGSAPPQTLADLNALGAFGQTVRWAAGTYVVLGDGSDAWWNGLDWQPGRTPRPQPTGVVPAAPGIFLPVGAATPADLAALQAFGNLGQGLPWKPGDFVVLADNSEAHWNGSAWAAGRA